MTLFILRRMAQALISILLITFVLYTYFLYLPPTALAADYNYNLLIANAPEEPLYYEGDMDPKYADNPRGFYLDYAKSYDDAYKIGRPWPWNFFLWLYDPEATMQMNKDGTLSPKGIDLRIGDLHITGSGLLTGDFGTSSVIFKPSLSSLLADKWINSLLLISVSLFLALLLAIPVGVISAVNHKSGLDTALTFLTFVVLSLPPFMLAFVLSSLFSILPHSLREQQGWTWMPMLEAGYAFSTDQEGNWINRIYHMIIPVATLALAQGALLTRHVRSSMLEVLNHDYIRTALAKGLSVYRVIFKHALRNALIPLIAVVSLMLPTLVSVSMIVERVMLYPGIGEPFLKAINACAGVINSPVESYCKPFGGGVTDFTLSLGLIMIMVVVVCVTSMLADILYVTADPRISFGKRKS